MSIPTALVTGGSGHLGTAILQALGGDHGAASFDLIPPRLAVPYIAGSVLSLPDLEGGTFTVSTLGGYGVDFFTPVRPTEALNPSFVRLVTEEGFSAARGIIEPMMRWYEDADGNFVEQFQTSGFDPRIWELYLFAALSEVGYLIDRSRSAPSGKMLT